MTTAVETRQIVEKKALHVVAGLTREEAELYSQIPQTVQYVSHPSFSAAATEEKLYGPDVPQIKIPDWTHFPEVAEEIVQTRSKRIVLSAADEVTLFLQYHYARYRLAKLVESQLRRQSLVRARQMLLWYGRAMKARANLVRANMALVLSMAKRTRIPNVEFSDLVSEGNMALLRSVEKFDVSRGFKFSTYGCRSILKSFNRMATKTGKYHQRFPTEFDPEMERSDYDVHKHEMQWNDSLETLREILARNRAKLSNLERTIVLERFSITTRATGHTLTEVGKLVGLTNERVRQIQNLAMEKIREALEAETLKV